MAKDGTLGQVADVAAPAERVLPCLQSRLQLLPQQQVVSGLLHLDTAAAKGNLSGSQGVWMLTAICSVSRPLHPL